MSETDRQLAFALLHCPVLTGHWDKAFVRGIARIAEHDPDALLSEAQATWLRKLACRYWAALPERTRTAVRAIQ